MPPRARQCKKYTRSTSKPHNLRTHKEPSRGGPSPQSAPRMVEPCWENTGFRNRVPTPDTCMSGTTMKTTQHHDVAMHQASSQCQKYCWQKLPSQQASPTLAIQRVRIWHNWAGELIQRSDLLKSRCRQRLGHSERPRVSSKDRWGP